MYVAEGTDGTEDARVERYFEPPEAGSVAVHLRRPPLADGAVDTALVRGTQLPVADSPGAQADALRELAGVTSPDGRAVVDGTPWRVAERHRPADHPVGWYALVLAKE